MVFVRIASTNYLMHKTLCFDEILYFHNDYVRKFENLSPIKKGRASDLGENHTFFDSSFSGASFVFQASL